jgi:hypothetical protein
MNGVRCPYSCDPAAPGPAAPVRGPLARGRAGPVQVVPHPGPGRQLPGLVRAARQGREFDPATGEPVAWLVPDRPVVTWLEHATAYTAVKWPHLAPHSRASLTAAVPAAAARRPVPARLQPARRTPADPATAQALEWLHRASLPLDQLNDPPVLRAALDALTLRLDGTRAAATTIRRKHAVLHAVLAWAIERALLRQTPRTQRLEEPRRHPGHRPPHRPGLPPHALLAVRQLGKELAVRESMVFLDGPAFTGDPPGLRTIQRGRSCSST